MISSSAKTFSYIKKNFFSGVGKSFVSGLSVVVLMPILIGRIGLELYGALALAMVFGGLSAFIDLGLSKALVYLVGKKKTYRDQLFTASLLVNFVIIAALGIGAFVIDVLSLKLFGDLNSLSIDHQRFLLYVSFTVLSITLLNNLMRSMMEACYLLHYANIGFSIYSLLLFSSGIAASFVTSNIYIYMLLPVTTGLVILVINLAILIKKASLRVARINFCLLKLLIKKTPAFLGIGLITSSVLPLNRYVFVLITSDLALFAVFDAAIKIAMMANSFLHGISAPFFGMSSSVRRADDRANLNKISNKVVVLLVCLYVFGSLLYFTLGNYLLFFASGLDLEMLYWVAGIFILGVCAIGVVEPYYRSILGAGSLKVSGALKLSIPVLNVVFYFFLASVSEIYRMVGAYTCATITCAILTAVVFFKFEWK